MESYAVTTPIPDQARMMADTRPTYSHIELLDLSRRLDWRFLLPEPDLERVAFLDDRDDSESLVRSLAAFSRSLTCVYAGQDLTELAGAFDLVVIKSPRQRALASAQKLLKPGGSLYLEAFGWGQLARVKAWAKHGALPLPMTVTRCSQMVQRAGFTVETVTWHWPDFETCTRMVPLDDAQALRFALVGAPPLLRKRVTRGWIANLVPCFSIVARKEAA